MVGMRRVPCEVLRWNSASVVAQLRNGVIIKRHIKKHALKLNGEPVSAVTHRAKRSEVELRDEA